jgi:hypothetical protein
MILEAIQKYWKNYFLLGYCAVCCFVIAIFSFFTDIKISLWIDMLVFGVLIFMNFLTFVFTHDVLVKSYENNQKYNKDLANIYREAVNALFKNKNPENESKIEGV